MQVIKKVKGRPFIKDMNKSAEGNYAEPELRAEVSGGIEACLRWIVTFR